jgi:hypothetical protein
MTMLGAIGDDESVARGGFFIDSMQNVGKPDFLQYTDSVAAARLWEVSEGLLEKYLQDPEAKWL